MASCSLNKLIGLNTWPLVGETIEEKLGSMALLEEVCHWEKAFKFQNATSVIPSAPFCLLVDQGVISLPLR